MKEIDDTPLPETESEPPVEEVLAAIVATMASFRKKIDQLEVQMANLVTRKNWQGHQDENDDPEWYA